MSPDARIIYFSSAAKCFHIVCVEYVRGVVPFGILLGLYQIYLGFLCD